MSQMQRREVFSSFASRFKKVEAVLIRPPYCDDATLFNKECPTCEDKACATFCEEEIIKIDEKGLPYVVFQDSGCTYCDKCAYVCSEEVLNLTCKDKQIKARVFISTQKCLAWQEVMCSSCLDVCDPRAIKFFGVFRPTVQADTCTSCGFCASVCPSDALVFKGEV